MVGTIKVTKQITQGYRILEIIKNMIFEDIPKKFYDSCALIIQHNKV